jgi:hypothetical protein
VGTALGLWEYLSGYLMMHRPSGTAPVALHLGTCYDVLWRLMPRRRPGERLFLTMHRELYLGLCAFCARVERGEIAPETTLTTSSYFLTPRQMSRYGFTEAPVPLGKKLAFLVGYPEVLLQQWLITGRLRFYHPFRIRFFRATAADVARRHSYFSRLARRSDLQEEDAPRGSTNPDPARDSSSGV